MQPFSFTRAQLIQLMDDNLIGDDDLIAFGIPAGDYWRTLLATAPTRLLVEPCIVSWSDYHSTFKAVPEDEYEYSYEDCQEEMYDYDEPSLEDGEVRVNVIHVA